MFFDPANRSAGFSPSPRLRKVSRQPPMGSKLSRAKPGGSIFLWQLAQLSTLRCFASCSRMVVAPRMSGSMASTSGGGFGGGVPRMRSSTQEPRMMGEVVVPFAVTFKMLPIVSKPPR